MLRIGVRLVRDGTGDGSPVRAPEASQGEDLARAEIGGKFGMILEVPLPVLAQCITIFMRRRVYLFWRHIAHKNAVSRKVRKKGEAGNNEDNTP